MLFTGDHSRGIRNYQTFPRLCGTPTQVALSTSGIHYCHSCQNTISCTIQHGRQHVASVLVSVMKLQSGELLYICCMLLPRGSEVIVLKCNINAYHGQPLPSQNIWCWAWCDLAVPCGRCHIVQAHSSHIACEHSSHMLTTNMANSSCNPWHWPNCQALK